MRHNHFSNFVWRGFTRKHKLRRLVTKVSYLPLLKSGIALYTNKHYSHIALSIIKSTFQGYLLCKAVV